MFVHGLPMWRNPLKGWVTYCWSAVIGARAEPVSFAYSRLTGLATMLWPHGKTAARLAGEFLGAYSRLREARGAPAIIAHSLGSYLVAQALSENPDEVAFRGVIFFGSIVPPDYDWMGVVRRGQVPARHLRNEVGLHDWPLRWAGLLGRAGYPYGRAGLEGFGRGPARPSIDHPYAGAASARGLARYCREVWLPFLGLPGPAAPGPPWAPASTTRAPVRRQMRVPSTPRHRPAVVMIS